jgi:hypothetical protein
MSWIRVEVFAWLGDNAYFLLSPVVLSENVTMLRNFGLSLLLRRRDCRAYFPLLARLPILTESEDSLRREKSEELSRTNRRNQADPTQPEKLSSSSFNLPSHKMYPYQGGYGQPQYGQQPLQSQATGFMPMQVSPLPSFSSMRHSIKPLRFFTTASKDWICTSTTVPGESVSPNISHSSDR